MDKLSDLSDSLEDDASISSARAFNGLEAIHVGSAKNNLYLVCNSGTKMNTEKIPYSEIEKISDTKYGVKASTK